MNTASRHRYACILLDDAFKLSVCTPEHEDVLRGIIELLIPGKHVGSLILRDKEQHGLVISDKNATFDLYCTDKDSGEQFIVEMQMEAQASFRDRALSYATYPIQKQLATKLQLAREGKLPDRMDYSLHPVYVISMVNFQIPHEDPSILEEGLISRYCICNRQTGEPMTDALHFVYLELGRLRWGADEGDKCESLLEQFAFAARYMHTQSERPASFTDPFLLKLYEAAELAAMTREQRTKIDRIMTTQLDINGWINHAYDKGVEEGHAEGLEQGHSNAMREVAEKLLQSQQDINYVSSITGLSVEALHSLMPQ